MEEKFLRCPQKKNGILSIFISLTTGYFHLIDEDCLIRSKLLELLLFLSANFSRYISEFSIFFDDWTFMRKRRWAWLKGAEQSIYVSLFHDIGKK